MVNPLIAQSFEKFV